MVFRGRLFRRECTRACEAQVSHDRRKEELDRAGHSLEIVRRHNRSESEYSEMKRKMKRNVRKHTITSSEGEEAEDLPGL